MRERKERASAGPVRGRWPKRKRRAGRGRLGLRAGVGRSVSGQKGEGSRPARASGLREEKEKQALGPNKRKRFFFYFIFKTNSNVNQIKFE